MHEEKTFYQQLLFIAVPVALQNLITSSINTVDTMMISTLGDATIAGVGLANQFFFFYFMICFGITTGSAVLTAQYWGRRNREMVQRVTSLAVILSISLGIVFTLLAFFFAENILNLMIQDPEVIAEGGKYLRVVALSYIPTALSFAYGTNFRTTGNPKTPLVSTVISLITNIFFNYVLIFGAFGFPRLGVVGAAWGTIIARFAEFLTMYYTSRNYQGPLNVSIRELLYFDRELFPRYINTTYPVIINETFWSLGQVLYNVAFAMIGKEATAAVQVVLAVQNLAFVVIRGLSSSGSVMIGEQVGLDRNAQAQDYAMRYLKLSLLVGTVMGLAFALSSPLSLQLFGSLSTTVYDLAQKCMWVMGVLIIIKSFNSVLVVAVLRGGGDTQYSMFTEMTSVWLVGVPLAFIGAAFLKLPVYWVMGLVGMEEVFKAALGFKRVHSGKWIRNVT